MHGEKIELNSPKFPALSSEVTRLKAIEGSACAVCEIMEKYIDEALKMEHIEKIQAMLKEGISKEIIFKIGYTEDEYSEAERQLMQLA